MKIVSWNVDGISAVLRKSDFTSNLWLWQADIFAFQETKTDHRDARIVFPGYYDYWSFNETCDPTHPQSGVAVVCKRKAKSVSRHFPAEPGFETEGSLLNLEFDLYYFVNVYVPQRQDEVAG